MMNDNQTVDTHVLTCPATLLMNYLHEATMQDVIRICHEQILYGLTILHNVHIGGFV